MENQINKVVHKWCAHNDRWIYVEYNYKYEILGINFMQGDDYDLFKKYYTKSDEGLTEFYESYAAIINNRLGYKHTKDSMDFINEVMWIYSAARVSFEDSRAWNCQQCSESRSSKSAN